MLFSQFGKLHDSPLSLTIDSKKILVVHDPVHLKPEDFQSDLVMFGHTHEYHCGQQGNALVINPGEAGGWLHGRATIALYDTSAHSCVRIDLGSR